MKKILVAAACCAPFMAAQAQSNVTLYGIMDAAVSAGWGGNGTNTKRLDSGVGPGSRLGFRGNEDLGGGLKAMFTAEMGIAVDTGTQQQGGTAFGRQIFVGLGSGDTWAVTAGRQYSPSELAITASDALIQNYWGSSAGYGIGTLMSPASNGVPGTGCQGATVRVNNSVLGTYQSGGLLGRFMVGAGDENRQGTGRLVNPSIQYNNGALMLTAAYTRMRQCAPDFATIPDHPGWQTETIVGGSYDFGVATMFTGYYDFNPSEANKTLTATTLLEQKVYWLGTRIPVGEFGTLIGQVAHLTAHRPGPDGKATSLGVSYLYNLSKRTRLYVSAGYLNNNASGTFSLAAATAAQPNGGAGTAPKVVSFGISHSF